MTNNIITHRIHEPSRNGQEETVIFWPFVIVYFTLVGGWIFALGLTAAKDPIPPPDDN